MKLTQELWQDLLDNKWFEGSNQGVLSKCAFCKTFWSEESGCDKCSILKYCGDKMDKIGQIYNQILNTFHEKVCRSDKVKDIPKELIYDLRNAIQEEIEKLNGENKNEL